MKNVYQFILPVFILLSVEAKSQSYTYIHFPEPNLAWYGYETFYAMGSSFNVSRTYYMYGDTVLNNKTYRMIGAFYFREDSIKRVYYIKGQDTTFQERLLYDFSLSKGDTMQSGIYTFTVMGVDTSVDCGTARRKLHVSIDGVSVIDTWAEGIGSTYWSPLGIFSGCGCSICWIEQASVKIEGCNNTGCQGLFSDIDEPFFQELYVFPNPCFTSFTLQLASSPTTETYFTLYDAMGRLIRREEINSNITTLNRNNLPGGIYFWQLESANKILDRGKLIME